MKPEYILMISAGGVFLFLLFLYVLIALESKKRDKKYMSRLYRAYSKDSLPKIEYDIAFYDKKFEWFLRGNEARQVTFDDILNESSEARDVNKLSPLLVQVEDEGIEEIHGGYASEKDW